MREEQKESKQEFKIGADPKLQKGYSVSSTSTA
jgi:hypothetical protein